MSNASPRRTPGHDEPSELLQEHSIRSLDDPDLPIGRDISFLEFQRRVLQEAQDESNPLLERLRFLSILSSNLDEFYMVRVSALRQQATSDVVELDPAHSLEARLNLVSTTLRLLMAEARQHLHRVLRPALADAGIRLLNYSELAASERAGVEAYFIQTILPVLTPLGFDARRPFARTENLSLNLAVLIRDGKGVERFAQLQIPETIPQFVPVACARRRSPSQAFTLERGYVFLEEAIAANLHLLFSDVEILHAHAFRVTRNAEIDIEETNATQLLDHVEWKVHRRHFGAVTRLGVSEEMPQPMLDVLRENLGVGPADIYTAKNPLALNRLMELVEIDRADLHFPAFSPRTPGVLTREKDLFAAIRDRDILLHHPYESFQPVVNFLRQAAHDPDVLAIKMTLYRVGRQSPMVQALLEARRNGKQVTAVVELKARFDEESNIRWARELESAGVHVVYGFIDLKVHCKLALVVRREGKKTQRYVHISSGNYNALTSRFYTDLGLFTCDPEIAADVTDVFNFLTGYSAQSSFRKLLVGPVNLKETLRSHIFREIGYGSEGRLIFKMNALVDEAMIQLLYKASQAGVQIDLIVRGVSCLRPGIPGISDTIRLRSIVGRFLEHSRIYYFGNGGNEEIYIGSADLMPRNLERRVEVLTPIHDSELRMRLKHEILGIYLADTVKAREMRSDGSYVRSVPVAGKRPVSSQQVLADGDGNYVT